MKQIILTAAIVLTCIVSYAQSNSAKITSNIPPVSVSLDSLQANIGKLVKATGMVQGVKETGKVAFINVGGRFPNAPLTLFIPNAYLKNFQEKAIVSFDGKEITVVGKLEEYNGKPQIVIQHPEEITIDK